MRVPYPLQAVGADGAASSPFAQGVVGSHFTGVPHLSGGGLNKPLSDGGQLVRKWG